MLRVGRILASVLAAFLLAAGLAAASPRRAASARALTAPADGTSAPRRAYARHGERRAFPASASVIAAAHYISGRAGRDAFAVIDDRGALAGVNVHERFHSASTVKVMLLVAYLQMLAREHRRLDPSSGALLYPMIHVSDNEAASAVLGIVGQSALNRVAAQVPMADYEPAQGWWAYTEVSASDLARLFFHLDALVPRRYVGYARWLLSTIEPSQSWGVPAVARPAFQVFFKTGELPESEGLFNEAARLEQGHVVFALAVLTTADPSMAYGEETIEGVTRDLLRARLHGRS